MARAIWMGLSTMNSPSREKPLATPITIARTPPAREPTKARRTLATTASVSVPSWAEVQAARRTASRTGQDLFLEQAQRRRDLPDGDDGKRTQPGQHRRDHNRWQGLCNSGFRHKRIPASRRMPTRQRYSDMEGLLLQCCAQDMRRSISLAHHGDGMRSRDADCKMQPVRRSGFSRRGSQETKTVVAQSLRAAGSSRTLVRRRLNFKRPGVTRFLRSKQRRARHARLSLRRRAAR